MIYNNYLGGNENATTRKSAAGRVSATKHQLEALAETNQNLMKEKRYGH
jgi:hypothetical protein